MTGPETVRLVLRVRSSDADWVHYLAERGLGTLPKSAAVRAQAVELLTEWANGARRDGFRFEVEESRLADARADGPELLARLLFRPPLRSVLWHGYTLRRLERRLRAVGAGAGALAPVAADVAGELVEIAAELETAARAVGAEPGRFPAK